jgi:hypothetical protein
LRGISGDFCAGIAELDISDANWRTRAERTVACAAPR